MFFCTQYLHCRFSALFCICVIFCIDIVIFCCSHHLLGVKVLDCHYFWQLRSHVFYCFPLYCKLLFDVHSLTFSKLSLALIHQYYYNNIFVCFVIGVTNFSWIFYYIFFYIPSHFLITLNVGNRHKNCIEYVSIPLFIYFKVFLDTCIWKQKSNDHNAMVFLDITACINFEAVKPKYDSVALQ